VRAPICQPEDLNRMVSWIWLNFTVEVTAINKTNIVDSGESGEPEEPGEPGERRTISFNYTFRQQNLGRRFEEKGG
jgi:hypothetical protein